MNFGSQDGPSRQVLPHTVSNARSAHCPEKQAPSSPHSTGAVSVPACGTSHNRYTSACGGPTPCGSDSRHGIWPPDQKSGGLSGKARADRMQGISPVSPAAGTVSVSSAFFPVPAAFGLPSAPVSCAIISFRRFSSTVNTSRFFMTPVLWDK